MQDWKLADAAIYVKSHYLGITMGSTTLHAAFAKCALALGLDANEAFSDLEPTQPEDIYGLLGYKFWQLPLEEIENACR